MVNRRGFLTGAASIAAVSPVRADSSKKDTVTSLPVMPPGAGNVKRLLQHCTACGLCVANCPSGVIRPATLEYGIGGMLMPRLSFEQGFCDVHCQTCSTVCPAGALLPLTKEAKSRTKIGRAIYIRETCVVEKDKVHCGICAEHCPSRAIDMHKDKNGREYPEIKNALCIGCGTCAFFCPGSPKAIRIVGMEEQTLLKPDSKK